MFRKAVGNADSRSAVTGGADHMHARTVLLAQLPKEGGGEVLCLGVIVSDWTDRQQRK